MNQNRGTLGKNHKKENERHPEYKGKIEIDGKLYWLAAWVKENKTNGEKFFSINATLADGNFSKPEQKVEQQSAPLNDEIPF